jgi:hypothetical protein
MCELITVINRHVIKGGGFANVINWLLSPRRLNPCTPVRMYKACQRQIFAKQIFRIFMKTAVIGELAPLYIRQWQNSDVR